MEKANNPQSINTTRPGEIGFFKTIVASGPVIIQERDNALKTLLVKHGHKPSDQLKWKFPGGKLLKGYSLKDNAVREAKEEIGVEVNIIGELPTMELWQATPESGDLQPELVILVHYLAEINQEPTQGKEILAMQWFDIHNLPSDCSPNIKPIIEAYKKR